MIDAISRYIESIDPHKAPLDIVWGPYGKLSQVRMDWFFEAADRIADGVGTAHDEQTIEIVDAWFRRRCPAGLNDAYHIAKYMALADSGNESEWDRLVDLAGDKMNAAKCRLPGWKTRYLLPDQFAAHDPAFL